MSTLRYASVMCLSYQSFQSSHSMTKHLLKMEKEMMQAGALQSNAAIDNGIAAQYAESSGIDQQEAETLQENAVELEAESAREQVMAEANLAKAEELNTKAAEGQLETDALVADTAISEQAFLDASEQALAESAIVAKDMAETTSDGGAVALCEFIPFVDILCDIVGSVAAMGLESHAAKVGAQSAIDAAAAAAAKMNEEELLAEIETLEEKIVEEAGVAAGYTADAEKEAALAAEEETEAARENTEALALFSKSHEEELMAEDEVGKAEEEEMEAGSKTENSLRHGLGAFTDAFLAGIFSFMSMTFFFIRFMVAIIIPGGANIVGFIPYANASAPSVSRNGVVATWASAAFAIFPKREIAYFIGHCGIFASTMFAFGSHVTEPMSIRNTGGMVIWFAIVAALAQTLVLHLLPLVVSVFKTSDQSQRPSSVISSATSTIFKGLLYLIPLFLMELCELKLLSSKFFFATDLSKMLIPLCGISLVLIILLAVHHDRATVEDSIDNGTTSTITTVDTNKSETSALLKTSLKNYDCCDEELHAKHVEMNDTIIEVQQKSWTLHQYLTDLKLPFEILVMTCMFVKLRECSPVAAKLVPRILDSHPYFYAECIAVLMLVSATIWCLQSSSRNNGHLGIWTGRIAN